MIGRWGRDSERERTQGEHSADARASFLIARGCEARGGRGERPCGGMGVWERERCVSGKKG